MTKTLTEQWREGTLPEGWYYTIITGFTDKEKMMLDYFIPELHHFEIKPTECIKEILSPVPSYKEYKLLQKQLDIAKTGIEFVKDVLVGNKDSDVLWDMVNGYLKATLDKIKEVK